MVGYVHHAGVGIRHRGMGNDIATADATDIVRIVILMIKGQCRHVKAADVITVQYHHRLFFQSRRVVDDIFFRQAVGDDAIHRFRQGREGLGGGGVITGDLGLEHRTLLDGPDRIASLPIEGEDQALLGVLDHRRYALSVHGQIHQHRWGGQVVIPLVAVMDLEMPAALTSLHVQRQQRTAEEIVAGSMTGVGLHCRGVRHHIHQAQFRVGGSGCPG